MSYRLGGAVDLDNDQIAYRLGQQTDARTVMWIGADESAEALGVASGQTVTGDDVARVRAIMDGAHPVTGEVLVAPKLAVAEVAKVGAIPAYDAVVTAAIERGVEPGELFTTAIAKADWGRLERGVVAKGDAHRVPVERLARMGEHGGIDIAAAYEPGVWEGAWEARDQRDRVGVMGYDVGLNLPKGASVGMVMDTPERQEAKMGIWRDVVRQTYEELGERVAYGSTGHHGDGHTAQRIAGSGIVGTATVEATSRDGDPHIHAHAMIANMTLCEDGTWRTIGSGGHDVMMHGAWANERAQLKYRSATAAAGLSRWEWNPHTKSYDDAAVCADARALASKRHHAIVAEKDTYGPVTGRGERAIDEMAERVTRSSKEGEPETLAGIATRFGHELGAQNISLDGSNGLDAPNVHTWTREDWVGFLDETLTEHSAVFTRIQVEAAVQRAVPIGTVEDIAAVTDAYLTDKGVRKATAGKGKGTRTLFAQRFTTQNMVDREKLVYDTTEHGLGTGHHGMAREQAELALATYEAAEGFAFNDGQRAMFLSWTTGNKQVDLTIGAAGTGKTAAADAARYAWEARGLRVMGISTAGLAAQNLGDAAGMRVSTAAALVHAIGTGNAPAIDVLVWDEMGMASAREQAAILPWAAANGIDVRGLGDPKQLDSVGAGSLYGTQCGIVGAVELTDIMRQKRPHERAAVVQLREGNTGAAMRMYADAGQMILVPDAGTKVALMAAAWAKDAATAEGPHARASHAVMLSDTNATVAALHAAGREHARENGWITGDDVTYRGPKGTRAYAVGETVLVRKNVYSKGDDDQPEVFNGQRAIITGIAKKTKAMTVEWERDGELLHRTFDSGYVARHVGPGYALTNYGAQGQTIDHVHADPGASTRNGAYVQLTRGSHSTTVYMDLESIDVQGKERVTVMGMDRATREQWAAGKIAERIDGWGWVEGETAHEATNTPVPKGLATETGNGTVEAAPAAIQEWDTRHHRLVDDDTLARDLADANQAVHQLSHPVTDADLDNAERTAADAERVAQHAETDYQAAQHRMESAISQTLAEADQAMDRAGDLHAITSTSPGLNPGRRKEHRAALEELDSLDNAWGQPVPDYDNQKHAQQFRADVLPGRLAAHGVDPAAVHAKKSAADQQRAAATAAARQATQLARRRQDVATSPGLAAATRHRDELRAETHHRDTLPPDQSRAEHVAREQAVAERAIQHQAESTANMARDLNDTIPEIADNTRDH